MSERAVVAYARDPSPDAIALFSSERVRGVELGTEEVASLSQRYFALYESLIGALAPRWAEELAIPPEAARVFSRRIVVAAAHFFLDRLIRLDRLISLRRGERLFIAQAPLLEDTADIQRFEVMATFSVIFNQSALCMLAPLLGLPVKPWLFEKDPFRPESPKGFVNFNFSMSDTFSKTRRKAHLLAAKALGSVLPRWRGAIPSLSMGYETGPLETQGFYGRGGLVRLDLSFLKGNEPGRDPSLRTRIFMGGLPLYAHAVRKFLEDSGARSGDALRGAPELFASFLVSMTPPNMLEAIPSFLERTRGMLMPYRGRPILTAENGHLEGLYATAAARSVGMKVVGCQHGGGPGNIDHARSFAEIEYPLYDRLITWGWRRFLVPNPSPALTAIPMPSPWLHERSKMWRKRLGGAGRGGEPTHDILLMSDKILPFMRPGMGFDALCSDRLHDQAGMLLRLVTEASRRRISILHKPCSRETEILLSETLASMKSVGGERYSCLDQLNKGLSPELVGRCRLVLWDKPATGFSECVAAGIPTMVLWPRFSSREPPWAARIFADLEACGVVHREPGRLCEEVLRLRASPRAWMGDPGRLMAVRRFRRRFAWSSPDWPRRWRKLIRDLAEGRARAGPGHA